MTQRDYQRNFCKTATRPILNAACKEDPYWLGTDFDAVNLDYLEFDPHTNKNLHELPNFRQGDLRALDLPDKSFPSIVVGEFIEHCLFDVAVTCLSEVARVLTDDGHLCLTFPVDPREKVIQHAPQHLVEWAEGITSWHQTVWSDAMLADLFAKAGLQEVNREPLSYGFAEGWGITLVKSTVKPTPDGEAQEAEL